MYKQVGDYELKTRIGRGNYADVYLGIHQRTKEQYAIKVIAKEKFSHPKLIAGLESEVKIMKEFSHRNILSLKKYFSSANNFYLVMEYCAGGDLNKFIRKISKLREEHAFNFLTQLAEGIAFLNEHGFIHRDLKTANVLLTEESVRATLKIADFGFARHLQTDALAQTPCGTPLYMAPEVLSAGQYDAKADIWSIGCIFYEMLSGQSPFTGLNEADLLNNIRTKELRAPPDVSPVSVSILKRLLEKNIASRASIQDLLQVCHHISRLSQSQAAQQAMSTSGLSQSQTKTAAVVTASEATVEPTSSTTTDASDSKNNNNFDLDIDDEDGEDPSDQLPGSTTHETAEDIVSPPTVPATITTATLPTENNNQQNIIINASNTNIPDQKETNNNVSNLPAPAKPSLQLPVESAPTTTLPALHNPMSTAGKGNNDNSHLYDDYEIVDNTNISNTNVNSKVPLKTSTKQPQKSQLTGALSPIPPTPSYIPINNNNNNNNNNTATPTSNNPPNANNPTNIKSAAAAIFKTVSSDTADGASSTTGPNYPSHPTPPQQQSHSWYQHNLLQLAPNNAFNNNNSSITNNSNNNAVLGGSSTMYQYQDLYQKNMLQRWEVLGPLVLVMTQVADHWIHQDMLQHHSSHSNAANHTSNNNNNTLSETVDDATTIEDSPFALPTNANPSNSTNNTLGCYVVESADQVAVVLKALALYLHALSLVKTFLLAIDIADDSPHGNNNAAANATNSTGVNLETDVGWLVLTRLRQDVVLLFAQLTARAEQCTFLLGQCSSSNSNSGNTNNTASVFANNSVSPSQWKATMPKAEALMLQEALLQEQEAEMAELLGKLDRAQKLYEAARHLLVGVLLTFAEENVDLRKQVTFSLKNVVDVLEQKIMSCKERSQVMRREFEPLEE